MDHEVLRAGPLREKLAGALAGSAGAYRVLRVVEEPDAGRPRPGHGRLREAGAGRRAGRGWQHRARHACAGRGLLHRRHLAGYRCRGARRAWRPAHRQPVAVCRANGFQRAGRAFLVHQPRPARHAGCPDVPPRRAGKQPDGRRVPTAAPARSYLPARGERLPERPARRHGGPDGVERRRHPHAVEDAQRISAPALPAQRTRQPPLPRGRKDRDAERRACAGVRGGHRDRPRGAVEERVQSGPSARQRQHDFPADQRRA